MKRLAHFAGYWLWIGFAGGAGILLLVATPLEESMKARGLSRGTMEMILAGVALTWVIASGIAAFFLERLLKSKARIAAHFGGAVVSAAVFMAFLQAGAGMFAGFQGEKQNWGERFTFGPFPREEDCAKIKADGYTGVISLLNPLVPFEAVLIEEERVTTKKTGLEFIEVPMLPWITENTESLEKLKVLVKSGTGRYYVHCYLGRHRADLARFTILEAEGKAAGEKPRIVLPDKFERGKVMKIGEKYILGPLPTKDEWFEFVVRSGARHVVSLMDETNSSDRKWIEEEKASLKNMGLEFHLMPAEDDDEAAMTAEALAKLEGGVYIHSYRPDEKLERLEKRLGTDSPAE